MRGRIKMIHLDLFSGIGGFSLAARWVWGEEHKPIFCEIDSFCQKVLKKHWPNAKIFTDIKELTYEQIVANTEEPGLQGRNGNQRRKVGVGFRQGGDGERINETTQSTVDLLTGGFPCQPFSVAGKRQGEEDDRYLWPEMLRVISEVKPRWIIGENVTGILNMGFDDMLVDLEAEGYETETLVISACAVGARHRRDRVWIVANSERMRGGRLADESREQRQGLVSEKQKGCEMGSKIKRRSIECGKDVGNSTKPGFRNGANGTMGEQRAQSKLERSDWWAVEPNVGRVAHGIPQRVDRLKGLGNAIVPQVATIIMKAIKDIDEAQ